MKESLILKRDKLKELDRIKKLKKGVKFCKKLESEQIEYEYCIAHPESIGCDDSEKYYARYQHLIGKDYGICKHLFVHEKKGLKRKFLIIVDSKKSVDLKQIKEMYDLSKLEFCSDEELEKSLHTYKGNISIFNIQYDIESSVEVIIDEELLSKKLLAFHPLYNGMSIFMRPESVSKYLTTVKKTASVCSIPSREQTMILTKKAV